MTAAGQPMLRPTVFRPIGETDHAGSAPHPDPRDAFVPPTDWGIRIRQEVLCRDVAAERTDGMRPARRLTLLP